ncbi:uncharacterized protein LOC141901465 [Tubulanus polymorphus]|uniref:uncharacterized protein LOC141901465 n=1 Tax=Tubulanus polymorphus TaxID=672921 RepID=UPI003DA2C38E
MDLQLPPISISPVECEDIIASNSHNGKRDKRKSKVWQKVIWFTRKSSKNHRDQNFSEQAGIPDENAASLPADEFDFEFMARPPWTESSSSSDTESSGDTNLGIRRTATYPNSEIVEQNCLKPSVARALFQRMEATNLYPKSTSKIYFRKRQKKRTNDEYAARDDDSRPSDFRNANFRRDVICYCRESAIDDDGGEEECDNLAPIRNFYPAGGHLCKKRPIVSVDADGTSRACKKRSSFSSLRDLYESQNVNSLFSSLPSHYGSQIKNVQQQVAGRPYLCTRKIGTPSADGMSSESVNRNLCGSPTKQDEAAPSEVRERMNLMKRWFVEFSDEQRNIFLKEMMGLCELPQIHLLSLEIEPRMHQGCPENCQDLITWLPASISLYILSFLDPVSLCYASTVCRVWNTLANDPSLWQRFCSQYKWRLSAAGEQKQVIHHLLPDGNIHWKQVFAERFRLRNNWLHGRCQVRTFEGHTQGISCVQFDDTRIVSGSSDKMIKVWNIRTNTPWSVQTLVGHSGTVRCLHLDGNRLVSGSTDRTIKVWDLSMQQSWSSIACKVTMTGHTDTVRCLQVDDEKIISGSYDKTLKVWDMRTGDCRMTLRGHDGAVLCVQFDDDKIISGSSDRTIKLWNFTGFCIMTLQAHQDAVTCLQFDKTRIISGSLDCNLKFWDINTGCCVNTIDWKASEGHTGVVRCLQADKWRVVSASDDRTIKVWNLETGERLVTLRNHTDGVTCLQFNDSIIVSGSYDKTVKLWDFTCC